MVQPEPQVVRAERFFDGNDDTGSIGCNLSEHPGIAAFQEILTGLEDRSDVQAVYTQIRELDPGEDSWPFTDTVLVAGTISTGDLTAAVSSLEPTKCPRQRISARRQVSTNSRQPPPVCASD